MGLTKYKQFVEKIRFTLKVLIYVLADVVWDSHLNLINIKLKLLTLIILEFIFFVSGFNEINLPY